MKNALKYRLFTEDLEQIFKVKTRKVPRLPRYEEGPYDPDEHSPIIK
jgi:hypothetical protein